MRGKGRKISADVDGGLSGVSRCGDTGARTPIGVSGILIFNFFWGGGYIKLRHNPLEGSTGGFFPRTYIVFLGHTDR